jgi:hypothetical protein
MNCGMCHALICYDIENISLFTMLTVASFDLSLLMQVFIA